jgi:uncharacterized protein (DUF2252 family)
VTAGNPGAEGDAGWRAEHPTSAERAERGKAARERAPRSAHGEWEPPATRRDPIEMLEEQARTRVADLIPIRYGRMLLSPFAFFRGAAYVMAADLATAPRTGLKAQLSGDAHLSNFGIFAAPDRRQVFGANDFDETLPGPFEWDLKRLVASFAVAGRDRGFSARERRTINLAAARAYRLAMRDFAQARALDLWYSRLEVDEMTARWGREVRAGDLQRIDRNIARGRAKDHLRAFSRLTELVDGQPRIISDPPLIVPIAQLVSEAESQRIAHSIRSIFQTYRRTLLSDRRRLLEHFRYADAARKVVGVGSVGTRVWIVLLLAGENADPLFLQLKEAQASVLEPFLGKSRFRNHGQRVVEGQRLTQAAVDTMLGWTRAEDIDGSGEKRDYYVRQLWDGKARVNIEAMDARTLGVYAEICGWSLAHTHARSGDPVAIASYLGRSTTFDGALARFAEAYADQNERDFAALERAAADGRIQVERGL